MKNNPINRISKISNEGSFIPKIEMQYEIVEIRPLTKEDMEWIVLARKYQEEENGNGATEEYLKQYAKIIEKLFERGDIIAAGAFKMEKLISLAFFNLISFGKEKKTPYLCGVWTNPNYRGKGLATKVNDKLLEGVSERIDEMEGNLLLTVEGTEAAYRLYRKEGYERKYGEMSFLGDVCMPNLTQGTEIIESDEEYTKVMQFVSNKVEQMEITYSEEQFFSHPANMDGRMCRIVDMNILNPDLLPEQLQEYLQYFFTKNRFCKFNVNELLKNCPQLSRIFGIEEKDSEQLAERFGSLVFEDVKGQNIHIKNSDSVMENNIPKAIAHNLSPENRDGK